MSDTRLLGKEDWITATEICRLCRIDLTVVAELAELGLVSPRSDLKSGPAEWQFPATTLSRLRTVGRLMRDLGVNVSGAVLAVELLEVQRELERRIRRLERLEHE